MTSDNVIYTNAGPEIAVASTKAYTTQVAVFYLITAKTALLRACFNEDETRSFVNELEKIPQAVDDILQHKDEIHHLSQSLLTAEHTFMIGRGLDYPALLEASLKLKEISYIHSEAYAAGELKHGTLSLVTTGVPVVALATQPDVFAKMISNVKEVCARGAFVILITTPQNAPLVDKSVADVLITIPETESEFTPFTAVVILQLIAYYTSSYRGLDVDQPRNLAKSVTVE